jgi:hypothetical protein
VTLEIQLLKQESTHSRFIVPRLDREEQSTMTSLVQNLKAFTRVPSKTEKPKVHQA